MIEENEKKALETLEETRQAWAVIVNRYIKKLRKENKELKETLKCTQDSWYNDTQKLDKLQKENTSLKQENDFLKRLYSGTEEFKSIERKY